MRYRGVWPAVVFALCLTAPTFAQIPTPESVLGFVPGTDRKLVEWPTLVSYYRQLAEASDRVEYRELGRTTLGAPFVLLIISSPDNLARLDTIRDGNARLADPRLIASATEQRRLVQDGKTIVLITSSIHSTEVGGHLSPTIIAHRLATDTSVGTRQILDQTVLLLVPSLNPDGVTIVSRWYNQTLDTPYEGSGPPTLYHHYVGHDNNRDWYAFTQVETQLTIDSIYSEWHPHVVHDMHQQGQFGSRFFLPPYLDPVEPNVDPLLVQGFTSLGTHMAWEMGGQGKRGIVVNAIYDAWTPARAYQHHHGAVRILSETASARLASPIEIVWDDLRGRRGFDAQTSSWNYPRPWPGGTWRLSDIVDYQSSGAFALLGHAAVNREVWLANFVKIGQRAINGWPGWPYAYVIPKDGQNTAALHTLLGILERGEVEIRTLTSASDLHGRTYPAGTYVVVLRQPYASFAKALLEVQRYPDLRLYPGGPPKPPYDVTAHTLPLLMGVDVALVSDSVPPERLSPPVRIPRPHYWYDGASHEDDGPSRTALYRGHLPSMDEGWTRWIFETWRIPYESVSDAAIRAGGLRDRFDVIIIPDMSADEIVNGLPAARYPPAYAGGIGAGGVAQLRAFVESGGTLVVFNGASFAIRHLGVPVRDVLSGLGDQEFYAPGTLFRLRLETDHPIARGMPAEVAAWFQRGPAFEVTDPVSARVLARWADDPSAVLLSGWVLHPERVAGKGAIIEADLGAGTIVLFGFRPQYRAQSLATFPLLFNLIARDDQ